MTLSAYDAALAALAEAYIARDDADAALVAAEAYVTAAALAARKAYDKTKEPS